MRDSQATIVAGHIISRIQGGEVVDRADIARAFLQILEAGFDGADVCWGALFAALHTRGPSADEVAGLVDAVLDFDTDLAIQIRAPMDIGLEACVVAITGSGKESFKTFNVSTAAAFVAAAHPDVCVVKPAGRATSAVTGASDLLSELDIRTPRSLAAVREMALRSSVGVFDYHLVAPRYGPRYEGRFHHLHPLSYVTPWLFVPIRTDGLVFGVADERVDLAASMMALAGLPAAMVVSTLVPPFGRIDELAPFGRASVAILRDGAIEVRHVERPVPPGLQGVAQRWTGRENAQLFLDVLHGQAPAPALDLVQENAAAMLQVAGVAGTLEDARRVAAELMSSGKPIDCLRACREVSWGLQ